eukprot:CAMPEP_0181355250 /NCGR_PEP_ID=MMETSP1106-20121128/3796_1 /TAXON_ID=81844 /ORGANISM="Mantoniella antarctica, Strain SL-175" /LENGTH=539 /DNA_ID=CAMNT_0023467971 /DNA_START=47 /DNA_END=1666 /DNA_ORIENTATION=-
MAGEPPSKRVKTTPSSTAATMAATVKQMDGSQGFDAVVVCTSNAAQEAWWQARLEATRGQAARADAIVVAVHEDWAADGAGNGLGTLYAYTKARAKAAAAGHDLDALLASGGTVGVYHTAGKGTRLAPLPGAENNNKPGVKLPSLVDVAGAAMELTILEAVVRQTGCYAPVRKGRCSVFWGDQIFVPSAGHAESGAHHADILAQMGPMPSEAAWKAKGLDTYGLIAVNAEAEAAQVEKVSYDTAKELLKTFGEVTSVGPSLGSFSLSGEMLTCLLEEFKGEIAGKEAKMDSDPHFWMPLTLSRDAYCRVMVSKEETEAAAGAHHDRMAAFKKTLLAAHPGRGVLGAIDVGDGCYWWDYGQLRLYQKNNMLAMDDSEEAAALRDYLKIPAGGIQDSKVDGVAITGNSLVLASNIASGSVHHTIASHVTTGKCEANGCMLINVTARSIKATNCIIYNVVDDSEGGLVLPDGAVHTNVFVPGRPAPLVQTSSVTTDGGKVFKVKMTPNPFSFSDVYKMNQTTDVEKAYAMGAEAHANLAKRM